MFVQIREKHRLRNADGTVTRTIIATHIYTHPHTHTHSHVATHTNIHLHTRHTHTHTHRAISSKTKHYGKAEIRPTAKREREQ